MARVEKYRAIQISPEIHERLVRMSSSSGLSMTKLAALILESKLNELEKQDRVSIAMQKDKTGETKLVLL